MGREKTYSLLCRSCLPLWKSTEALRFKSEVIKKFNNSKFFIVCPLECFPILKHSWGIDENFIIGLSRDTKSKYTNINNEFIYKKNKQHSYRIHASPSYYDFKKYISRRI